MRQTKLLPCQGEVPARAEGFFANLTFSSMQCRISRAKFACYDTKLAYMASPH